MLLCLITLTPPIFPHHAARDEVVPTSRSCPLLLVLCVLALSQLGLSQRRLRPFF